MEVYTIVRVWDKYRYYTIGTYISKDVAINDLKHLNNLVTILRSNRYLTDWDKRKEIVNKLLSIDPTAKNYTNAIKTTIVGSIKYTLQVSTLNLKGADFFRYITDKGE